MAKWCIGIDLGGTFIKFGLLDDRMRPVGVFQLPTPIDRSSDGVVDQMVAGAKRLISEQNIDSDDIVGVGIGSPGPLDLANGVVLAMPNIPGMDNAPLRDRVSEGLALPAVLENDANAAAYGEYLCGAGKGACDIVMLTLGTGVGGGIVIDGKVLHGSHGIGAELGHMIVQPGGERCGCGQEGCLERYCSATYLAEYAVRLVRDHGRDSALAGILNEKGSIDARDINEAHKAGDVLATELWDREAHYLALGCVSLCRIFDPDRIVLAGGLAKAGDDLLEPVREHFSRLDWKLTEPQTEIVIASLGNDAGVIGAAGVAWETFDEGGAKG